MNDQNPDIKKVIVIIILYFKQNTGSMSPDTDPIKSLSEKHGFSESFPLPCRYGYTVVCSSFSVSRQIIKFE